MNTLIAARDWRLVTISKCNADLAATIVKGVNFYHIRE